MALQGEDLLARGKMIVIEHMVTRQVARVIVRVLLRMWMVERGVTLQHTILLVQALLEGQERVRGVDQEVVARKREVMMGESRGIMRVTTLVSKVDHRGV